MPIESVIPPLLVSMAAVAAVTDAKTGRIPNWLTLPPLAAAPVLYGIGAGLGGALFSVAGAAASGLGPFLLFRRGGIGGGDVKLFAALGAVAGWRVGLELELAALFATALYALGRLAWRGRLLATLGGSLKLLAAPFVPAVRRAPVRPELMETVRMGGPIFIAVCVSVLIGAPLSGG